MSGFWPKGLDLSDTRSPLDILQDAREEWEKTSAGILTLVFQEVTSQSGNKMIVVHAKHVPGNRTTTLFSVMHRPRDPYPVTIELERDDLPDVLKKTYYKPGVELGLSLTSMAGRTITNEWVSDTPAEFRNKLTQVFNLGSIKQVVLSLVSHSPAPEGSDSDSRCSDSAPES